ncbi:MAG: ModD protein [Deltaproteobacteria bacterium]|nr:ModD protein [Deltaproteobacteria bacterium]MBN2673989.1 ModD protein [Deltaproteobacteria bacterium]
MIRFSDYEIEKLMEEDMPVGDLTSELLGLNNRMGQIVAVVREEMVACGTEEAARLFEKAGLVVENYVPSGTKCQEGDQLLEAWGNAAAIHSVWRAGGIFMEFASGIATRTFRLVQAAQKGNPETTVAGSRKHVPFAKKMALKALYAGGGIPHRTGLSDSILVFREHLRFLGGYEPLAETVQRIRSRQKERMIVVEAHTLLEALSVAQSGAHFVQLDKMDVSSFRICVTECRKVNQHLGIVAAGGINEAAAMSYAEAGADVLVTSWMYAAPPADIGIQITQLDNQICAADG